MTIFKILQNWKDTERIKMYQNIECREVAPTTIGGRKLTHEDQLLHFEEKGLFNELIHDTLEQHNLDNVVQLTKPFFCDNEGNLPELRLEIERTLIDEFKQIGFDLKFGAGNRYPTAGAVWRWGDDLVGIYTWSIGELALENGYKEWKQKLKTKYGLQPPGSEKESVVRVQSGEGYGLDMIGGRMLGWLHPDNVPYHMTLIDVYDPSLPRYIPPNNDPSIPVELIAYKEEKDKWINPNPQRIGEGGFNSQDVWWRPTPRPTPETPLRGSAIAIGEPLVPTVFSVDRRVNPPEKKYLDGQLFGNEIGGVGVTGGTAAGKQRIIDVRMKQYLIQTPEMLTERLDYANSMKEYIVKNSKITHPRYGALARIFCQAKSLQEKVNRICIVASIFQNLICEDNGYHWGEVFEIATLQAAYHTHFYNEIKLVPSQFSYSALPEQITLKPGGNAKRERIPDLPPVMSAPSIRVWHVIEDEEMTEDEFKLHTAKIGTELGRHDNDREKCNCKLWRDNTGRTHLIDAPVGVGDNYHLEMIYIDNLKKINDSSPLDIYHKRFQGYRFMYIPSRETLPDVLKAHVIFYPHLHRGGRRKPRSRKKKNRSTKRKRKTRNKKKNRRTKRK
jgi:hypothetical protein